jgi:hypothetical protein
MSPEDLLYFNADINQAVKTNSSLPAGSSFDFSMDPQDQILTLPSPIHATPFARAYIAHVRFAFRADRKKSNRL